MFLVHARRYVPLVVWLVCLATLLIIPLRILSYGYLPHDDALRHAAKAVCQKEWPDILVMRSEFALDHNPGWHAVLGGLHRAANWDADTLVIVSVGGLFILLALSPLPWLRRPEAWLASLLGGMVFTFLPIDRFMVGRPFLFTMAVLVMLLFLWSRSGNVRPSWGVLLLSTGLIGAAVWIHGAWYLLVLPIGAFVLAGRFRAAVWLGVCWLAGSFLGALCTGHPWQFLTQAINIASNALGSNAPARLLVAEFSPSDGSPLALVLVGLLLLWRRLTPARERPGLIEPVFVLAVVGWILGLKVVRTWVDWGVPALLVWSALELQDHLEAGLPIDSLKRLLLTAGLAAGLVLSTTADRANRWSWNIIHEYLDAGDKDLAGWLPDAGGVLYSADMEVFYGTFFKNPQGPWKYALGFEPTFMPADDLQVYRDLRLHNGDLRLYGPWVEKMRPADRLVLPTPPTAPGNVPGLRALEWHRTYQDCWIGRLPRATNAPAASSEAAPKTQL